MAIINQKKQIRFITNPFSGGKSKSNLNEVIWKFLDHDKFDYEISYTKAPKHATELAQEARNKDYYAVIAVGGDGTINEVASALLHTDTIFGVIPYGSGNGFSYHIGLRRNIVTGIQAINDENIITIDSGKVNGRFFINIAGMGLDAVVAYKTKLNKRRGFWPYFFNTIKESFGFKYLKLNIRTKEKQWTGEYAMAAIANGSIYGYDFAVAPEAELNDGLFDIILVKRVPVYKYLMLIPKMLNKSFHKSKLIEYFKTDWIEIKSHEDTFLHVDGEGQKAKENLTFEVNPASIKLFKKLDT